MVLTFESQKKAESVAQLSESAMAQGAEVLIAALVVCICLSLIWVQFRRPGEI